MLRRYALLFVVVGVGACASTTVTSWQTMVSAIEVVAESTDTESVESDLKEEEVVQRRLMALGYSPAPEDSPVAETASPISYVPDAPPTPPPDQNA